MRKISILLILLQGAGIRAMAQGCSVCTKTAAGLGESSAHGLNTGILYLAAIPLAFIGTVGFIWYRRSRGFGE